MCAQKPSPDTPLPLCRHSLCHLHSTFFGIKGEKPLPDAFKGERLFLCSAGVLPLRATPIFLPPRPLSVPEAEDAEMTRVALSPRGPAGLYGSRVACFASTESAVTFYLHTHDSHSTIPYVSCTLESLTPGRTHSCQHTALPLSSLMRS